MRYTWHGQILSVIATHLKAAFVFFFVFMIAIAVTGTKTGGLIYSSISAVFYFIIMYATGYAKAKDDKKSYSELTPIAYKGAVLSLGLLLLNILALVLYRLSWLFGSDGEGLTNVWAFLGNIVGMFWFSPYINLLGAGKGSVSVFGYALIVLLHTVACFLGYLAGYKDFDISAKMKFLVYEKKKSDR